MSVSTHPYKLSLGPLQFHWSKQVMLDFYRDIESTNLDIVYLGETVCSKRREFGFDDWMNVAERLLASGELEKRLVAPPSKRANTVSYALGFTLLGIGLILLILVTIGFFQRGLV